MKFTIRGKIYELTQEDVLRKVANIEPQRIYEYYIEIGGRRYPIKQVLALATALPPISFTSKDAYDILSRLGFEIKYRGEKRGN